VTQPPDPEARLARLEARVEEVAADAAAARHLAAAHDRDIADVGVKVNACRAAINALGIQTAERFDRVERRLGGVEGRLGGVEGRLGGVEGRLDGLEQRVDVLETKVDEGFAQMHRGFAQMRHGFDQTAAGFARIATLIEGLEPR
jgi:chromosome segregation ATPase